MNKDLLGNLAWGGGIVVLALIASRARAQGMIDHETTTRIVLAATGLMIAWMGNRLPKQFVSAPWAQRARRVAGWSLAISGLIYAGLWAFAPVDTALWGGSAAVITGMIVTFGYCLSMRNRAATA